VEYSFASDSVFLEGVPVLIVDDNSTNRRILTAQLRNWNMRPSAAASGPEALDMLREASDRDAPFTLILLDVHMPRMDGFEVASRVQGRGWNGFPRALVMFLSSGNQRDDTARCRELGISAYLTKPVRSSELRCAISRVLLGPSSGETAPSAPSLPAHPALDDHPRLRVLLVEDNPVNQRLAQRILQKEEYTVALADNGKEALETLARQSFDLILMDVQMPVMDGFDATRAIRVEEKKTGTHTPIIATTAHAMTGDRERCLAAGMDNYISKPIRAQDLVALVAKYCAKPVAIV
jgi:two-component system sensor histidine kinase/response regulator